MDQAQEIPTRHPLAFHATRRSFAKLLLVNSLLTLLTLGIYRFWAKTSIRRYFWRNVSFLDDPLEYTGTGGELFVGFLIVIAVLFPLGMIYGAIQTLVPPDALYLSITLEVTYYLVLFALLQIGFYRAWRYRMSRTRWRGVRFGLDGSTWTYLRLAAGWTVLTAVTLGAAYPWMQIDLWRYQIRHTRLGDQSFHFEGNAARLFPAWLPVFAAVLVNAGVALWAATAFGVGSEFAFNSRNTEHRDLVAMMGGIVLFADALGALGFIYYRVCQTRFQISGLRFGDAAFHSGLPFLRLFLFGVLALVLLLAALAVLLGIFSPSLIGNGSALRYGTFDPATVGDLIGFTFALIFLFVFAAPFVWTLIYTYEVVKQVAITTAIDNPHVLEHAAQSESEGPRTGEGLADALDIGGF
ncbi:MAG: DUF898 family protein [Rhodospirillales bacterium]|nr:DUF898 family protein [Rhodospirillales bacterium]MBO6787209.1 DUF898 family protein [Rhodospirillales bacterium]